MSEITVKVRGLRELERELAKLDRKLADKAMKKALREAAKMVLAAAREQASRLGDSGATRAALRILVRKGRQGDTYLRAFIAPNAKAKRALAIYNRARAERGAKPVKALRHFHLFEFGRSYRGNVQIGERWLTKAFDRTARKVPFIFRRELRAALRSIS